ncbi:MAG: AraC family transcriptional regulator [Sphingomonadales bacterium]|nr:AraC family transcriptional regulator [Sphingomonadales bacterium]
MKFLSPPESLRRYFTSFYCATIVPPPGHHARDLLHPEWANLRFFSGARPVAEAANGTRISGTLFSATGPSTQAVRFAVGATRLWGVGLLPLGWAKFVHAEAAQHANTVADGHVHPAFASFRPLAETLFGAEPDIEAEFARIAEHFLARIDEPLVDEQRILAIHEAVIDPEIHSVAVLVERTGGTPRTIERVCRRTFGFAPKVLLRRQRFMRSLAQFMLDPTMKWSGAMDGHYHDQAQFVRDFRQFMGMTPSQYAALDKPIIGAVMRERARIAGAAVQTLDRPTGGAVSG